MKKLFFSAIAVIMMASLVACGGGEEGKWQSEKDSIMNVNEQQQQVLDDLTASLVEVSASLDSITAGEGMLRDANEGPVLTKKQMLENLATFKSTLAENKAKLAELEKTLANRNDQLAKLSKVVKYLNTELEAKEARINQLEEELSNANANIAQLRTEMTGMSNTIGSLQEENDAQRMAMESQEASLNVGYYIIATKKELNGSGLTSGGTLTQKRKINYDKFDQASFVKIDTRTTQQITVPSKKVKILTGQPEDSYTITTSGGTSTLKITDVSRFWSVSRYLIIQKD